MEVEIVSLKPHQSYQSILSRIVYFKAAPLNIPLFRGRHYSSFYRICMLVLIVSVNWRIPLGDSGILNFFLQIFGTHTLGTNLVIQTLRLIGNSCADTGTYYLYYLYHICALLKH